MTGNEKLAAAVKRTADGFTLIELMTVVAILGVLATMALPSLQRLVNQQRTRSGAMEMAGLLSDARGHAVAEGTPYLVYFNPPSVDGNGDCGAAAVEVRDTDHSYSITPGDQTHEFHLPAGACNKVKQYGEGDSAAKLGPVPMPSDDLAVRAPDASLVGAVVSPAIAAVTNVIALLAPATSPAPATTVATVASRSTTVMDTVVNGATFPLDADSGRPVIAFSERGVPVDPADPNAWGSGAGGVYLTDGESSVYAALVAPLGDIQLRVFDPSSGSWK